MHRTLFDSAVPAVEQENDQQCWIVHCSAASPKAKGSCRRASYQGAKETCRAEGQGEQAQARRRWSCPWRRGLCRAYVREQAQSRGGSSKVAEGSRFVKACHRLPNRCAVVRASTEPVPDYVLLLHPETFAPTPSRSKVVRAVSLDATLSASVQWVVKH